MGRRRGKKWNSCLMWFVTSLGALFYTCSCLDVEDPPVIDPKSFDSTYNSPPHHGTTASSCPAKNIKKEEYVLLKILKTFTINFVLPQNFYITSLKTIDVSDSHLSCFSVSCVFLWYIFVTAVQGQTCDETGDLLHSNSVAFFGQIYFTSHTQYGNITVYLLYI